MNKIITILILTSLASLNIIASEKKDIILNKQLKKAMKDEKKYANEQVFYNYENYDFKGSEVNQESLKNIKELDVDDLDMDSVYD